MSGALCRGGTQKKGRTGSPFAFMLCISDDARISVPVMFRLVRPFHRYAKIVGLLLRELGQLYAHFFEVQARDFFVELLGQAIDTDFVTLRVLPRVGLREDPVGDEFNGTPSKSLLSLSGSHFIMRRAACQNRVSLNLHPAPRLFHPQALRRGP